MYTTYKSEYLHDMEEDTEDYYSSSSDESMSEDFED
jgi:hypothetical protein